MEAFDPSSMISYPVICVSGSRRAGKTTLVVDLLRKLNLPAIVYTLYDFSMYTSLPNTKTYACETFDHMCSVLGPWDREPAVVVFDDVLDAFGRTI
jgi:Ni2+-binding GTPase involved in maturation of urease and hydrogenase